MFDLLPVFLEGVVFVEIGAIVDIVAFQTFVMRLGKRQLHFLPQFGKHLFARFDISRFGVRVIFSWAMAILTTIPQHVRCLLQRLESRLVRQKALGVPAGRVAGDAFRVEVPWERPLGGLDN